MALLTLDTELWSVCQCGHFQHDHKLKFIGHGACEEKCACRKYKQHDRMTYEAAIEYRRITCSLSQPPTSGTSQNPSPSQYQTGGIVSWSQTVSSGANSRQPSPSTKVFQPEARLTPVVGFRSWHSRPFHKLGVGPSFLLGSYNDQFGVWKAGRNEARCHARTAGIVSADAATHEHTPDASCTCGFYVLTDFDSVPFYPDPNLAYFGGFTTSVGNLQPRAPMMVGAVVGWGRVVQHGGEGWRAEFAQVIALLDCKVSDEHLASTHQVAEAYGVPVVGRKALELMAMEYGDALRLPVGVENAR